MAYRRFEILDVRLPTFLQHDATHIKVLNQPDIDDKDATVIDKLLVFKDAKKKDDIIKASNVSQDNVIEVDTRDLLRVFEFNLNFENTDVYYVTYDIWYNDVTSAGWARPNMVTRDTDGYSRNDVEVITPTLEVTTDPNNAELGGFRVLTSKFKTFLGSGVHKYTSWFIKDFTGNVIWKQERSNVNLDSIRIPNNILDIDNIYVIKAIHFSDGNVPSNPGKLIIKTKGELTEVEKYAYAIANNGGVITELANAEKIKFGYERPVLTGGKDSIEDIEDALEKSIVTMVNANILNGNLEQNITLLNNEIKDLNNEIKELNTKLANSENNEKELKELNDKKEQLINNLKTNITNLQTQLSKTENELKVALKNKNYDEKIIINLEDIIYTYRKRLDAALNSLAYKNTIVDELTKKVPTLNTELVDMNEGMTAALNKLLNYILTSGVTE